MRAEQVNLEHPQTSGSRTVEIQVPFSTERPAPARVVREADLAARPSRSLPSVLSGTLSKFLVFEQKYRWYRAHGYGRAEARAKARWHARAAPCPFAAP